MLEFFTTISHLLPVAITSLVLGAFALAKYARQYLRYVALVSQAIDDGGVERLARYLASRTGGKKISIDEIWESFIPAAQDIHNLHIARRVMNNLDDK